MARRGRPPLTDALTPFGVRLRELIATSPYVRNRQEMCRLAGFDQANLRLYETNPDRPPPLDWLIAIGRVLHVGLDELYPTSLHNSDPPYPAWAEFRSTELGKAISDEERDDLAAIRPRHHVPTVAFYIQALMALRGTPAYRDASGGHSTPPQPG